MTNLTVLTTDELAQVVAGLDADRALRERTGMCGCGLRPDKGLHLAH